MPIEIPSYDKDAVRQQLEKYMALGFSPIWLRGKVAHYAWKTFTLTKSNMNSFLRPGINWGLRTGKLRCGLWFYALDLDSRDLLTLMYEHCPALIEAPLVSTGKGFHLYALWFEEPKTRHFEGVADLIANGYCVCPPSVHPTRKKKYTFIKPLDALPPIVDPASIILKEWETAKPLVVSNQLGKSVQPSMESSSTGSTFAGVSEGQRHSMLVHIVGVYMVWHFTQEESLERCLAWNGLNKPPMTKNEVISTVNDLYERYDVFDRKKDIKREQ
jgi:hypothetical protein